VGGEELAVQAGMGMMEVCRKGSVDSLRREVHYKKNMVDTHPNHRMSVLAAMKHHREAGVVQTAARMVEAACYAGRPRP